MAIDTEKLNVPYVPVYIWPEGGLKEFVGMVRVKEDLTRSVSIYLGKKGIRLRVEHCAHSVVLLVVDPEDVRSIYDCWDFLPASTGEDPYPWL